MLVIVGCGGDDDGGVDTCGDGVCDVGETPSSCAEDCPVSCGDGFCTEPEESLESCPEDCGLCTPLADVSELIGGQELFFGYSVLGKDVSIPDCGDLTDAKEVLVSFTPELTGALVLSTVQPSTQIDTVLEVRTESCDGSGLGCNDHASAAGFGSRIVVPVQAGQRYVALVETADNEAGVFALGLHREGVCEGVGVTEDITPDLLTGRRFDSDTSASTASMRGRCGAVDDNDNPEVLYTFTAPRSGTLVATTALPGTNFDTLLYVREGALDGPTYCDSPEVELACGGDAALRFEVQAGRAYSLFVDGVGAGGEGQASVHLGYGVTSPARLSLLGCDHAGIQDQLGFFVESGQAVFLNVDTVDAATAADMRLRVRNPDGSELYEADDDVPCTHPPPSYSCPEYSFTAASSGLYYVEVYVGASQSCYDHNLANYQLTVTVDQQEADLILVKDQ
ncbi:MAG: hypothetical protein ABI333_21660 [bacterium]